MVKKEEAIMKKYVMILAAITAAVTISSCTKEQAESGKIVDENGMVRMTFAATAEDADTKAVLNADGKTVEWEGTENVAVFDGKKDDANIFTATKAGATTSFTGSVTDVATEFVAVYPASAAVALGEGDKPISAIIPNVQEATLNSFDPAAALYVASSTDIDAKFSFKAAFALLKVNVDVENVVAVVVENTKNNFAGSVSVSTSAGVSNGTGTTYKTVTLKKSDDSVLAKGTYYIVVRHLGETSKYEDFSLSYITSDAMFGKRTTATVIDNSLLPRKGVLNVGRLSDVTSVEQSWYNYYQAGFDVKIGSKTINRSVNGDAELLTADNAVYTVAKAKFENAGVRFFKAIGAGTFNNPNNPTISNSTFLLSDSDTPVVLTLANVINLADGALHLKGFELSMTGGKTSLFSVNKNTAASMSDFVMDNCKVIQSVASMISTNSSYPAYGIQNIEMVNSKFAVSIAANLVNVTSTYAGITEYKSFKFVNNHVYSTTGTNLATSAFAYSGSTGDQMEVTFSNNLFYNTAAAGNIKHNTLKSVTAKQNVIRSIDASGLGANAKIFGMKTKVAIASVDVSDNVGFGPLAAKKNWTIADDIVNTSMEAITVAPSDPIASANTVTGTFTMASGYESYGPQAL